MKNELKSEGEELFKGKTRRIRSRQEENRNR